MKSDAIDKSVQRHKHDTCIACHEKWGEYKIDLSKVSEKLAAKQKFMPEIFKKHARIIQELFHNFEDAMFSHDQKYRNIYELYAHTHNKTIKLTQIIYLENQDFPVYVDNETLFYYMKKGSYIYL